MSFPNLRLFIARKVMSGFDAASRTITRIKNWVPSNTEVNTLIVADGALMRARSRKLSRENPWAKGALDTFVSNAIGTGIQPRFKHPDPAMRANLKSSWDKWSRESDANGMQDFSGLQGTACRAIKGDGEVFVRLRYRPAKDALHVPMQVQLLEADHCPYSQNDDTSSFIVRAGIKFNLIGQREAYFLYRNHPGSIWKTDPQLYEIPAETPDGLPNVLHCFDVLRAGQFRGEPWNTAAIIMLYDIKQLVDAALLRQKVVNLLSVWIKRGSGGGGVLGEHTESENGDQTTVQGLTPGSVNYIDGDEDPHFLTPPEAGVAFKEFLNAMLRAVARAMGVTFEQLTGDLSGVNYSSIRAGLLEFRRWCEAFQYNVMVHQFCRPIYDAWLNQALLAGVLGPDAMRLYLANPDDFEADWDAAGWPWVNPKEDIDAAKAAVRAGFTSRRRVVSSTGEDVEDIDREQESDNERADASGLSYDSDGRREDKGPRVSEQAPAPPPEDGAPQPSQQQEPTNVPQ